MDQELEYRYDNLYTLHPVDEGHDGENGENGENSGESA